MSADDTEVFPKVEDAEVTFPNAKDSDDESGLAAFDRAADREAEGGDDTGQQEPVDGAEVGTRKRKRSPWVSALTIVGVLALVCTGTTVGLALGLEHRYENKVTREDILGDLPKADVPLGTKTVPMNFLMLGSDDMSGKNQNIDDPDGSRSDTIMLFHINAAHNRAFVMSIPRDSFVDVPAGGKWKGGLNKINAAFAFGGAKLSAKTVYNLTKIPLDSAMIVNFSGIAKMVDAVGTVNICIPYQVSSIHTGRVWSAGCHDMGPDETADFLRQRKSVPGGDLGRIQDQQLVVKALADRITSEGILTNPLQLDKLISTAASSLTLDKSTNLRDLVLALKDIRPADLSFATVPTAGTFDTFAGSSVKLDTAAANVLFQAVIDDKADEWLNVHPQARPTSN
jgi:LCP family protein required for cell wall assembly